MQLSFHQVSSDQKDIYQKALCPGHLIQGNPSLQAVINISDEHPAIFFQHEEVVTYCNTYCTKTALCTEQHKKTIADIFKKYGKQVISPTINENVIK